MKNKDDIENDFVQSLCQALQERGIDTSNWDGDESPEWIIAYRVSCLMDEQKQLERQRCLAIVEQEEEMPGPMPDEVFEAIAESVVKADKLTLAEQLRSIVRSTKQSISSRIKEE